MLPSPPAFSISANTCFDPVVCSQILLFIAPEEWKVTKPFRISKTFHTSSMSETFAREYLCERFGLSGDEEKKLEELLYNPPIFRESLLSVESGKRKRDETNFEKRKNHAKSNCDDSDLSNPPTSFQQVFKWYIHFNDSALYRKSKEKLSNLIDDIYSEDFEFEILYQIVDKMKAKRMINSNFGYFIEGSTILTEELGKFELSSDEMKSIFSNGVQDEFIVELTCKSTNETKIFNVKCLIFTHCGYRMVVESEFNTNLDVFGAMRSINESFSVYGQEVFGNCLNSSIQGGFVITSVVEQRINERSVGILSEILGNNFEKNLQEVGILYEEIIIVKYQLLYNYLQCTLGEYVKSLWGSYNTWEPFAKFKRDSISDDEEEIE